VEFEIGLSLEYQLYILRRVYKITVIVIVCIDDCSIFQVRTRHTQLSSPCRHTFVGLCWNFNFLGLKPKAKTLHPVVCGRNFSPVKHPYSNLQSDVFRGGETCGLVVLSLIKAHIFIHALTEIHPAHHRNLI
jgi:hypothetical protein